MLDKWTKFAGATALAALMTTPALAQDNVADWDGDQDQMVSQDEFQSGFGDIGAFDTWDQDDDSRIDESEFDQGMSAGMERTGEDGASDWADADMAAWDEDQSGDLSENEFGQGVFGQYDQDESGDWSGEEWTLFQDDAGEEGFWDW